MYLTYFYKINYFYCVSFSNYNQITFQTNHNLINRQRLFSILKGIFGMR